MYRVGCLSLFLVGLGFSLPCLAKPPAPALLELVRTEQNLLSRSLDEGKIMSLNNYQDEKYTPELGKTFSVKSYWVDASKLHAFFGTGLDPLLKQVFFRISNKGTPQFRFLVHPESESFYEFFLSECEPAESFHATSTASSRTLLIWDDTPSNPAFFGKLSLNKEIAGVVRTIPKGEIARSIGTNNILQLESTGLPGGFLYFPETIGFMPIGFERGGLIIREATPITQQNTERFVPLFSLYAKPKGGGATLLETMVRQSGLTLDSFVKTKIFNPFIHHWYQLVVEQGIVMEPHAQNVLIGLDSTGLPNGTFLHRDFGGFNINLEYRDSMMKPSPVSLPTIESIEKDYHQKSHQKAINSSLHTYFVGGFVYNLDLLQEEWIKEKKTELLSPVRSRSRIHNMTGLFNEVVKQHFKQNGIRRFDDLSVVSFTVGDLRKKRLTKKKDCGTSLKVTIIPAKNAALPR